jgi:hypothetical protein
MRFSIRSKQSRQPSILFIVRGDATIPSCRFRAYQFQEPLEALGARVEFLRIERRREWAHRLRFNAELARIGPRFDAVVYQKLLHPGRLAMMRLRGARVFFDFDDAIYLEHPSRFAMTMRASGHVIAGNDELAAHARRHGAPVSVVPTTVIMPTQYAIPPMGRGLTLSWIGTADNLPYLRPVLEAFRIARTEHELTLQIVTERPECVPREPGVVVARWSPEVEERAFLNCHVGLMPLRDDAWSRGKCACKALQYLSYGRPVISSPVGLNRQLLTGQPFALLATDVGEWIDAIRFHARLGSQRSDIGDKARQYVKAHYDVRAWAPRLLDVLLAPDHRDVRQCRTTPVNARPAH